ncbi:MAG: hypothetical protein AB1486_26300 [Planctomycetota bacterium]
MESLRRLVSPIDSLLRGEFVAPDRLREGRIGAPARTLVTISLMLGGTYGLCMGLHAALRAPSEGFLQALSSTVKVPLLFLLTLVVTFPSLYAFSALAGSRLRLAATLRLIVHAIALNLAILASFGPVTAFFALCTTSYPFMKILNVIFFGVTGVISLRILHRTLLALLEDEAPAEPPQGATTASAPQENEGAESQAPAPARRRHRDSPEQRARRIFAVWFVVYGVVGAQMGWVLRPFIGSPDLPFQLFRPRQSSFFENVLRTIGELF